MVFTWNSTLLATTLYFLPYLYARDGILRLLQLYIRIRSGPIANLRAAPRQLWYEIVYWRYVLVCRRV